jgi:hypothetical protein
LFCLIGALDRSLNLGFFSGSRARHDGDRTHPSESFATVEAAMTEVRLFFQVCFSPVGNDGKILITEIPRQN